MAVVYKGYYYVLTIGRRRRRRQYIFTKEEASDYHPYGGKGRNDP